MELSWLKQFKEAAEAGSVSKAAEKLYISAPAVSKSIKKLEEELGVDLFERTKNSLVLNEAGKTALKDVELLLSMEEKLINDLSQYSALQNSLVIGTAHPSMIRFLAPSFSMARPDITIHTKVQPEEQNVKDVLNGSVDVAVLINEAEPGEIEDISFMHECLMLYVPYSHPFTGEKSLCVKDLDHQQFIFDRAYGDNYFQNKLDYLAKKAKIDIQIHYEKDYYVYRQLMRSNKYIYLASNISQRYTEKLPNRSYIPLTDPELTVHYHFAYRKDREKKVEAFISWLNGFKEEFL